MIVHLEQYILAEESIVSLLTKIEKVIVFSLRDIISPWSPPLCTRFMLSYFRRRGMKIHGQPNYISAKIWFDGADYSLIELNDGCTISSNVRILTLTGRLIPSGVVLESRLRSRLLSCAPYGLARSPSSERTPS